jgi:hypothetical protein
VDSAGNVFVTGWSQSVGSPQEYATVAYSSAGVPLWSNRYHGGNVYSIANALAVDQGGNVYVTGFSSTCATIKYSGAGVPLWTNQIEGASGQSITVDGKTNIFVAGIWCGDAAGTCDYGTFAYSSGGSLLWAERYSSPGTNDDTASAVAVDSSGNVFVAGEISNSGSLQYATVAYSSGGVLLWTNFTAGTGTSISKPPFIGTDTAGAVFVTGVVPDADRYYDYATFKYSAALPSARVGFQNINNQLVLTWTNAAFLLQSAPTVTGTFTNVLGTTSPYTNPISGAQQFFRLISN